MSTTSEEPTIHELLSRLAELEQAHARLQEELTNVRTERVTAEEQTSIQTRPRPRTSSRRKVLEKGLGVAAATVGAGALLELSSGTALAASTPKPGVFASSVASTPAVKATGTNGADGVDASSDSGSGVSATSTSGTGLVATSSSGLAGHFVGNVSMDNNLTVTGALSSGAGTFASGVPGTPAVKANDTSNFPSGIGVRGVSSSGVGVGGTSSSGTGVLGLSSSGEGVFGETGSTNVGFAGVHGRNENGPGTGLAGLFEGDVQVNGTLSATNTSGFAGQFRGAVQVNGNFSVVGGTKNFVQDHPTDPSREIVYVALEGGEAGTYVRGTGTLVNGKAVLALPEHFGLVTATEGLTIHLTPRGEWLQLYVVELDTAQIVVREAQGKSGAFDYLVYGVRRGYEQHEVIRTKR